jgi:hypothetical protein
MTAPLRYYKFDQNIITIGGRRLTEFGDDGGIEYSWNSNLVEAAVTADGVPVFSGITDPLCMATITVKQTGEAYKYLSALVKAQDKALAGAILPLSFLHTNLIQGDVFSSAWVIFENYPEPSFSKNADEVEFRMFLPYMRDSAVFGGLI